MQMSEIESAMYLRSDQQSLVPTSGLQPDLKELGTFSGTPTRILVTLILSLWYQIMYLSGKNRK